MYQKPPWIKSKIPSGDNYLRLKSLFRSLGLNTVCEEALCPNIAECWGSGTATIMILGDTCTRACKFCNVKHGFPKGFVDEYEPTRVALALKQMNLNYIVITSVDRDDLEDGGASIFAKTIREIKNRCKDILIEVLIPDFCGDLEALRKVVKEEPNVIAHNIETVKSLTSKVRDPRANYYQSLSVLKNVKKLNSKIYTKSSIMLGLGEKEEEVIKTMKDLREANVDFLTLGQYLRPTKRHLEVKEYIHPSKFDEYKKIAEELGFLYVASGPLVRSSYKAGEFYIKNLLHKNVVID
ncbi:Lipoyl synthase [archaeon HR06]|nr:Lipoyl synthase [archaeon HR06]